MQRGRPFMRPLFSGALAVLGLLRTSAVEAADFTCPTSAGEVFQVPSQTVLADYQPGDVLCDLGRVNYVGDGSLAGLWTKRKLIYVTNNSRGGRTAVSGTLVAPSTGGTLDLVVFAPSTVGLIDECAQSAVIDVNLVRNVAGSAITRFVKSGRSVAVPDYEGLGTSEPHTYLDGISSGQATLDLMRAVQRVPNPGVSVASFANYFMVGISQGAQAVSWAAQLHPTYAPELPLRGVISTATPANLAQSLRSITAPTTDGGASTTSAVSFGSNGKYSVGTLLAPFALRGVSTNLGIDAFQGLTSNWSAPAWKSSWQRNCTYEQIGWLGSHPPDFWQPPKAFFDWYNPEGGTLAAGLRRFKLGAVAPTLPIVLVQGDQDDVAPYDVVVGLQRDWCSRGGRVMFNKVAGGTHVSKTTEGLWGTFNKWFSEVAAGRPQNFYPTPSDTSVKLSFCAAP